MDDDDGGNGDNGDGEAAAMRRCLGDNIRAERSRRGWSQDELAERVPMSRATVSHWEAGERRIVLADIVRLCRALGVPLAALLAGDDLAEVRAVLGVGEP